MQPPLLFHNTVNRGQSQASSFSKFFGREEWLKDSRQRRGIHSVPGIFND